MTNWRQLLSCIFMTALTAGPAFAIPNGGTIAAVVAEPISAKGSADSGETQAGGQLPYQLNEAPVDIEDLGRISGGTALLNLPGLATQQHFAIVLWDEGKRRPSIQFESGGGQISSTILVQGR